MLKPVTVQKVSAVLRRAGFPTFDAKAMRDGYAVRKHYDNVQVSWRKWYTNIGHVPPDLDALRSTLSEAGVDFADALKRDTFLICTGIKESGE